MKIRMITVNAKGPLFLTVLFLFVFITTIHATTVVEPGRFILVAKPGERVTNSISVKNEGNKEIEVSAVIFDWTLDENDNLLPFELGTRKDTLNGFIKFNPRKFKLAPGAVQTVRYTITAPNETSVGERRGVVFFEEENQILQNGSFAKVLTQIGSTIYLELAPIQLKLRLVSAKVNVTGSGQVSGIIVPRNEGSAHVRFKIHYKIINEKKALVSEGEVKETVILPEFQKQISFQASSGNLPAGKYNLMLEFLFYNTEKTLVHTIPFEVGKAM